MNDLDDDILTCNHCDTEVQLADEFCPFLYSRKASPISLGAPSYTLFRASGEYDGHITHVNFLGEIYIENFPHNR